MDEKFLAKIRKQLEDLREFSPEPVPERFLRLLDDPPPTGGASALSPPRRVVLKDAVARTGKAKRQGS